MNHELFDRAWQIYLNALLVVMLIALFVSISFSVMSYAFKAVMSSYRAMRRVWHDEPDPPDLVEPKKKVWLRGGSVESGPHAQS